MVVRKVRWSRAAKLDLQEILEFINEQAPLNATRVADRIQEASQTLDSFAERGRVIPEFGDDYLREIFVSRFRIMYRVLPTEIYIVGVIHMSRNMRNILSFESDD